MLSLDPYATRAVAQRSYSYLNLFFLLIIKAYPSSSTKYSVTESRIDPRTNIWWYRRKLFLATFALKHSVLLLTPRRTLLKAFTFLSYLTLFFFLEIRRTGRESILTTLFCNTLSSTGHNEGYCKKVLLFDHT